MGWQDKPPKLFIYVSGAESSEQIHCATINCASIYEVLQLDYFIKNAMENPREEIKITREVALGYKKRAEKSPMPPEVAEWLK